MTLSEMLQLIVDQSIAAEKRGDIIRRPARPRVIQCTAIEAAQSILRSREVLIDVERKGWVDIVTTSDKRYIGIVKQLRAATDSYIESMEKSHRAECWALGRAVAALARAPDYSRLKRYNLRYITEFRALRALPDVGALSEREKTFERAAFRELKARSFSNCLIAELVDQVLVDQVGDGAKLPLSFLSALGSVQLIEIERKAMARAHAERISELEEARSEIDAEIRSLRERKAA